MSKSFSDLTLDEMEAMVLQKEPSLDDLLGKALLLLRASIVTLGRIQIVRSAKEKPPPNFFSKIYELMSRVSFVIRLLEETVSTNKKALASTEANHQPREIESVT
jgi:hypothetical protein